MNNIVAKKLNALQNIFNSYEIYKGNYKSLLETEISNLKGKLSEEDYNNLVAGFQTYKQYIFNVLASTRRVFIKLSEEEQKQVDFSSLDNIFEDLSEEARD